MPYMFNCRIVNKKTKKLKKIYCHTQPLQLLLIFRLYNIIKRRNYYEEDCFIYIIRVNFYSYRMS